jgi:uncharacterized membrane protein
VRKLFQPEALNLFEPVIWVISGVGIGGAIASGKFLLAIVVALVGLSFVLRLRKRIRALRRSSTDNIAE